MNKFIKKFYLSLIYLILFSSFLLFANSTKQNNYDSWYMYWGAGITKPYYSQDLEDAISTASSNGSTKHRAIIIDVYGFYFSLFKDAVFPGFLLSAAGDFVYVSTSEKAIAITQFLLGPSIFYFPFTEKKNALGGPFVRFELGLAKYSFDGNNVMPDKPRMYESPWGYGTQLALGYAYPFKLFSALFGASYAYRRINKHNFNTISIFIGLWI